MASLTYPADEDGLKVPVMVCLKAQAITDLLTNGLPIPAPITCRGIVDCGSTVTNVAPWIISQLGLGPGITATTQTAAGVASTSVHWVSLSFLDAQGAPAFTLPTVMVAELSATLPDADLLIGLNTLLECNFVLEGPARRFSFIF